MLRSDGYSPLSIVLHWLAAIFVVALFLTHDGERGSSAYVFHVSGGAIVGVVSFVARFGIASDAA